MRRRPLPAWFPYVDLGLATVAGGLWFLWPSSGPWPLVLVLAPWLARLVWSGRLGRRTPFDVPLLLFVGTAGLSVWSAFDREAAWGKFWLIVGGVFLFYALANGLAYVGQDSSEGSGAAEGLSERERKRAAKGRSGRLAEHWAWMLAAFSGGVAVYFLATHDWDVYPGKFVFLEQVGRAIQEPLPVLPGHRLHPNVAGGLLAMMMPFTALVTIVSGQRLVHEKGGQRPLLVFLASLALFGVTALGLLLSSTRGGWLALAAAGLLAGWGWLSRNLSSRRPKRRGWIFFGGLAVGFAALWLLFLLRPPSLSGILNSLPDLGSGLRRLDLYRSSLILVMDYPLIGAGLDGFMMLYSTYALLIHVGFSTHSHNLFLDVAIEQGLPALLVLAWMWLLMGEAVWRDMVGRVRRKRRRSRSRAADLGWAEMGVNGTEALSPEAGEEQSVRYRPARGFSTSNAAALSLVVMLVHGLVDDPVYGSRGVLLIFASLAFAVPHLPAGRPMALREQWPLWAGGLAVALLVVLLWGRPLLSVVRSNLAAVRQSRAELSVYSWPEWPVQDEVRRSLDMEPIIMGYERALALNPDNGAANRRLGQIELSLGEYEAALNHLEAAYRATPWDNATRQLLGEGYIVNGKTAEGQVLWAGVNDGQGQLDLRAFWYEYVGDEERVAAVRGVVEG